MGKLSARLVFINRIGFLKLILAIAQHPIWMLKGLFGQQVSEIPKSKIYQLLPDNPVIIEAGCADGTDTVAFAKKFPEGRIIAFEPLPALFEIAKERCSNFSHIEVIQKALGPKTGSIATLFAGEQDNPHQSASLLPPLNHEKFFPGIHFESNVSVETISVEDLVLEAKLQRVDLLWLDLQGLELEILETLSACTLSRIYLVHLEISKVELYVGQPSYKVVFEFFKEHGFVLLEKRIPLISGNALFMNPNFSGSQ